MEVQILCICKSIILSACLTRTLRGKPIGFPLNLLCCWSTITENVSVFDAFFIIDLLSLYYD